MSNTTLTKDRICTVLQVALYSMADNNNQEVYSPLGLKWVLPVSNTEGTFSVIKNLMFILGYVQEHKCSKECIDRIIENDVRPMVAGLKDEMDFILSWMIIVTCDTVEDYSNIDTLMGISRGVLGKFIEALEKVDNNSANDENGNLNNPDDFMDTSNLEIGLVIPKGYSELCKLVGEKCFKSGSNQRKAQEKRFKRYIKWEKSEFNGRTIIITDIYDEPLPKDDMRKLGNNNIYLKYIETILLRYVYYKNTDNQVCYITKNQLWRILGMINKNYKKIPYSILTNDIEYSDVKKWELDNFYIRCNTKLNNILYTALKNLKDRSLIAWNTQIMIVVPSEDGKFSHHYVASDDEVKKILKVERKVLKDMGFENKSHVMCKMKMPQFYENVNNLLFELYDVGVETPV